VKLTIYSIKPSKNVLKNIKKIDKSQENKLREFITLLRINSFPDGYDIVKMSSRHLPQFRVRFGKFRLIYIYIYIYLITIKK